MTFRSTTAVQEALNSMTIALISPATALTFFLALFTILLPSDLFHFLNGPSLFLLSIRICLVVATVLLNPVQMEKGTVRFMLAMVLALLFQGLWGYSSFIGRPGLDGEDDVVGAILFGLTIGTMTVYVAVALPFMFQELNDETIIEAYEDMEIWAGPLFYPFYLFWIYRVRFSLLASA
ncbi:hypothetical protein MSAN_02253400 [Mycena sanguinolenta]|uniref:Uncharacterized protein n=1 Tax=Mycena sanguinolenta TaxID=230812 RepID=A0A8H6XB34_9AGAR|nr:hypothetical protein MSAN_02253400 [Mycena sanguinolenta]